MAEEKILAEGTEIEVSTADAKKDKARQVRYICDNSPA